MTSVFFAGFEFYLRTPSAANSPMTRPAVPQPLRAPHARVGAPGSEEE